jgi:hypothetical protein
MMSLVLALTLMPIGTEASTYTTTTDRKAAKHQAKKKATRKKKYASNNRKRSSKRSYAKRSKTKATRNLAKNKKGTRYSKRYNARYNKAKGKKSRGYTSKYKRGTKRYVARNSKRRTVAKLVIVKPVSNVKPQTQLISNLTYQRPRIYQPQNKTQTIANDQEPRIISEYAESPDIDVGYKIEVGEALGGQATITFEPSIAIPAKAGQYLKDVVKGLESVEASDGKIVLKASPNTGTIKACYFVITELQKVSNEKGRKMIFYEKAPPAQRMTTESKLKY